MRLASIAASAALAMAMMLGADITPADAGNKSAKKRVHINSNVSTKNLKALENSLKGHQRQAVQDEIRRRGAVHHEKRLKEQAVRGLGRSLAAGAEGDPIVGLWALGVELGTRRKSGH